MATTTTRPPSLLSKNSSMADPLKHFTTDTGPKTLLFDLKTMLSIFKTRRTKIFVYGFMFTFVACTIFLAFSPTGNSSSPWFSNIFTTTSEPNSSDRSHFPSFFSYFFPNSSSLHSRSFAIGEGLGGNQTPGFPQLNQTINGVSPKSSKEDVLAKNGETGQRNEGLESKPSEEKRVEKKEEKSNSGVLQSKPLEKNEEKKIDKKVEKSNSTNGILQSKESEKNEEKKIDKKVEKSNSTIGVLESKPSEKKKEEKSNSTSEVTKTKPVEKEAENLFDSMIKCNIFDGNWVRDDSYPLYPPGSCPHVDEPFNCHLNSRPDKDYQRFRWQPKSCNIPRLDGKKMLELLRGKRLVFVGDSLNRNMWESLVCILRNSVEDKSKVFEASGRREFRTEGSYSFVYKDYNCSVEFFRSPFLVQEWELPESDGTTKETLRLDLVERSSSKYKNADVIVFNTGHWWTHEKTSKGKDYYQEGSHIYGELSVADAFRKALTTWARWVDANVNRNKTTVFFRGYSASHFRGGRWNSGGQCDSETQPIKNETYLAKYPPKMKALETVIKGMKTPVYYLNITRMTDYRKDAHPSVYRKQNLSDEERKSPLRFQDCSHWCLPGVPDTWNELLYAQLLIKQYEKNHHQQQQPKRQ